MSRSFGSVHRLQWLHNQTLLILLSRGVFLFFLSCLDLVVNKAIEEKPAEDQQLRSKEAKQSCHQHHQAENPQEMIHIVPEGSIIGTHIGNGVVAGDFGCDLRCEVAIRVGADKLDASVFVGQCKLVHVLGELKGVDTNALFDACGDFLPVAISILDFTALNCRHNVFVGDVGVVVGLIADVVQAENEGADQADAERQDDEERSRNGLQRQLGVAADFGPKGLLLHAGSAPIEEFHNVCSSLM